MATNICISYLVQPDAIRAPNNIHTPPIKAVIGATSDVVPQVPDKVDEIAPPNTAPPTYNTYKYIYVCTNVMAICSALQHYHEVWVRQVSQAK